MVDYLKEAEELFPYTQNLRRDFHRHPEIGFKEVRTAGIVAQELKALDLEVMTGVAETGVVALLEGGRPGPVVLLRFDMDALPVQEATGAEYASQTAGVMHACGHDGHTAIGLTVARLLHKHRADLPGAVKFVFQPAEEGLGGAEKMVAAGILENPAPLASLALHLWNEKPFGWVGIADGPTMAAADIFRVRIAGKGGHGALPHLAADPLLAAAQVVTALQSIVGRNVSPLEAAVVSVTTLHAGEAFNVIPSEAVLTGTLRTFLPEVRQRIVTRFQSIAQGVAQAMDCTAEVDIQPNTPAVVNAPQVASQVRAAARQVLPGAEPVTGYRTMGSEDMALMMQSVPGCYFFLGSANPEQGLDAPHHHPRFNFDERVLPRAVALMAAAAVEILNHEL